MTAKETAHKSAGWIGVALAGFALGQAYLERDTIRLQLAEVASTAEVNAVDEIGHDLDHLEEALTITSVLMEEREKTIDRLRERIEELERRHRIRTGAGAVDVSATVSLPAPPSLIEVIAKVKRPPKKPKADRIREKRDRYLEQKAF